MSRTEPAGVFAVAVYFPGESVDHFCVVVVRRPLRDHEPGYVYELPGGPAGGGGSRHQAVVALAEQTGLVLDPSMLHDLGSRRLPGAGGGRPGHLFAAQATELELDWLRRLETRVYEEARVEVVTVGELLSDCAAGWAVLGMVSLIACLPRPGIGTGI